MSIISRLFKSALLAAIVMPFVLAPTYMSLQNFGENFLNAEREEAFWKGMLSLYFVISMMIWMFWEARARENTNSS